MQNMDQITFGKALDYFGSSVGAMVIADRKADSYRALVRRGIFAELLDENGTYLDLIQKLWFHFNKSDKGITEDYQVFIPVFGSFTGKSSKRLNLLVHDEPHIVQMMIQPVEGTALSLILLDELDASACEDDADTLKKVNTIQNIYLFSMCFDLTHDTTSSISLTEVSEDTMNPEISYSAWRQMISKMFLEKDQPKFLKKSDPEYLRTHFAPGHIESFDIQMQNLDGVFIWVKLIFGRMDTTNENDYRFVYMVQNIHDTTVSMQATLKHYEELASRDPMTKIFNHGRLETELCNAIEANHKDNTPVSLLILDIDHFKNVNDRFGHAVGDTTLIRFAEIVQDALKGKNAAFGRWGGEEFAAVVYDLKGDALAETAELLRKSIEEAEFETAGSITCSVGASALLRRDVLETWFERADQALYTAKSEGRNRICVR